MNFGIAFAPLVPAPVSVGRARASSCVHRACCCSSRAAAARSMRAVALALFVLALANPSFTREDREPLTSVAVVVVDKSPSQNFGDRTQQTEAARAALAERLGRIPGLEVRVVEAGQADGETDGTRLFSRAGVGARRRAARPRRRRDPDHRRPRARRAGRGRGARLHGAGACADHRPARTSATAASC